MSMSFFARRSRLKREALAALRGCPDFSNLPRSRMFKFATENKFKLDSILNDAACIKVLEKKFAKDPVKVLKDMGPKKLVTFAKQYELAVNVKKKPLYKEICRAFELEVPEEKPKAEPKAKSKAKKK